ncbi:MAG TPA: ATP-binding cassette domain-containing protein, partial [Nocardioidaceae bacterium]|nr:ATP-binding cassette domain-containing protein [Nocardioidaceae bacterium]
MSSPVLDVQGLAFAYADGHQALFGVDLHVHRGERVALLGPNGAGKTTLVLHLNGILTAGRGTVRVAGLQVAKPNLQEIRRRVGVVFQDPDDQLFMPTVRDDVAF